MVSLCDETRFQVLPTEEEWTYIKQNVEKKDKKLFLIPKTHWYNIITRCKGTVTNIPIYGSTRSSERVWAITQIEQRKTISKEAFDREEYDKAADNPTTWSPSKIFTVKTWVFNKFYAHVNITTEVYSDCITVKEATEEDTSAEYFKIQGSPICCPVSAYHMFSKDEEELKLIMQGQLMGQNTGSPFQTVYSVANNYIDVGLKTQTYQNWIKRTAPLIQLLTKKETDLLRNTTTLAEEMHKLTLPKDESEALVKLLINDSYVIKSVDEIEELKAAGKVSAYYPVIKYDQVKDLKENIPKMDMDVACLGLGSAGTGILDQLSHSNYFNNYFLCDFDRVEAKNTRNQWYTNGYCGAFKAEASVGILNHYTVGVLGTGRRTSPTFNIRKYIGKFQEAGLEAYKFKYVISGFDSIEARLELLQHVKEEKIETRYIIDVRYDDLNASIFFVDTTDPAQVSYYEKGLLSDKEAFDKTEDENKIQTWEEFYKILQDNATFTCMCADTRARIAGSAGNCPINHNHSCNSPECRAAWKTIFENYKSRIQKIYSKPEATETSCVKQNFIDIYKYASTYVFAAIRELEFGNAKPFTHIECTTDVLPHSMVLRK